MIRRLGRGLYDFPRIHPLLGPVTPDLDTIAGRYAQAHGIRLQVSGAHAANMLGLSTQVPAKKVYLTDGATRKISFGKRTVIFRHAAPRYMVGAGTIAGAVFQALRFLGPGGVDHAVVAKLRERLDPGDREALVRDSARVPDWARNVVRQIAAAA